MTHPAPVQATPPQPFVDDSDFQLYVGNAIDVLRTLPDESVHCVVTSPPYFGLRDYSAEGQIGLEATPAAYVERLVEVFREVKRVVRKDATVWLNLGDSYAAQGGGKAEGQYEEKRVPGATWQAPRSAPVGLKPKDLIGVPWKVAFALQADGWYLRSEIIWAKKNCMPESVTDRPTKSHEQVFLLTRSPRYYFDQEAIREPHTPDGRTKTIHAHAVDNSHENYANMGTDQERWPNSGRNARSVWKIATQPYAEAHFATFPEELPRRCIAAGTSERGCCPECGAPWERESKSSPDPNRPQAKRALELAEQHGLTEAHIEALQACGISDVGKALVTTNGTGRNDPAVQALAEEARAVLGGYSREFLIRGKTETIGWRPGCECGDALPVPYRVPHLEPCVVLDPFVGSGTTALVARKLGRRSIGIELNPDYAQLAARRLQQLSLLA